MSWKPSSLVKITALMTFGMILFFWANAYHAIQIGEDEAMEFAKAILLEQAPASAAVAWNDQPWFSSQICAFLLSISGNEPWLPRLNTLIICIFLCAIFPRLMPKSGWLHLTCAWIFFWTWPDIQKLSISAMIELPAFALAVISCAILPRSRNEWHSWRFAASGAIFALAVNVKLTALLVLPAAALFLVVLLFQPKLGKVIAGNIVGAAKISSRFWVGPVIGSAIFIGLFSLIVYFSPAWNLSELWGSHHAAAATKQAAEFRFHPEQFLEVPGIILSALSGFILLCKKKRLKEAVFVPALIATLFIVHWNHRPWWFYYNVQFGIPLSILGGWGIAELILAGLQQSAAKLDSKGALQNREFAMMTGSLVVAIWMTFDFPLAVKRAVTNHRHDTMQENAVIDILKAYKGQVKWVYDRENIWAFSAGYLVPPELTNLCKKRFWTGQASEQMIYDTVVQYKCEILIIHPNLELKMVPNWNVFISYEYQEVWSDGQKTIYVAKRLHPKPKPIDRDYLKLIDR